MENKKFSEKQKEAVRKILNKEYLKSEEVKEPIKINEETIWHFNNVKSLIESFEAAMLRNDMVSQYQISGVLEKAVADLRKHQLKINDSE